MEDALLPLILEILAERKLSALLRMGAWAKVERSKLSLLGNECMHGGRMLGNMKISNARMLLSALRVPIVIEIIKKDMFCIEKLSSTLSY